MYWLGSIQVYLLSWKKGGRDTSVSLHFGSSAEKHVHLKKRNSNFISSLRSFCVWGVAQSSFFSPTYTYTTPHHSLSCTMLQEKYIGLILAMSSSLFIGLSFVITKKGLIKSKRRHGNNKEEV